MYRKWKKRRDIQADGGTDENKVSQKERERERERERESLASGWLL